MSPVYRLKALIAGEERVVDMLDPTLADGAADELLAEGATEVLLYEVDGTGVETLQSWYWPNATIWGADAPRRGRLSPLAERSIAGVSA